MPINSLEEITDGQYDVLREIGNIGIGNAMTALSNMLGSRLVGMAAPKVGLMDIDKIADVMNGPENPIVGILITLSGDVNGMMMFAMDEGSARRLANQILMKESDEMTFSHMDFSVLKEIGNVITGAYLTAISTMTGLQIRTSVPEVCHDMAGAILSVPAIEFGKMGDRALMIDSSFDESNQDINGYYLLMPDMESYNKIMAKFGL